MAAGKVRCLLKKEKCVRHPTLCLGSARNVNEVLVRILILYTKYLCSTSMTREDDPIAVLMTSDRVLLVLYSSMYMYGKRSASPSIGNDFRVNKNKDIHTAA